MICIYNQTCVRAGSRAYHTDEDEQKRICSNDDHIRVGQTMKAARHFQRLSEHTTGSTSTYYFYISRTIRENVNW